MAEMRIVKATDADVREVAGNLREEHVREIRGMTPLPPDQAVRLSAETARLVFAGRVEDKPVCLVGVSKTLMLSDTGSVWMVATPAIDDHPLAAALALRDLFARAHDLAGAAVLEQWIPIWYRKGLKWLLWLGWEAKGTRMIRGTAHTHMVHVAGKE